ncbi:adenylyltransferase/sulfurtransferase [Desmospora profundinema]|uniref:Adenylyltransferase/sulfurtransferase n=2 Tax=Desmospora profundinema TaxID=1571184 RepID=A0ABU1IRX8_9BACL|nr:adenylyltransferase/sulfurtransferase [Desmospora profundinema]
MGALGTALAHHLVRAGVGFIRLIDRDFVEKSNLQRQMLYTEEDARQSLPKAIAARDHLQQIHSAAEVEAHVADLTWRNAEDLLTGVDLILDGSDNFSVRYLVNDVALKHGIPWIYGGAVSSRGMTFTIRPGITPCLACLFPETPTPGTTETCDTAGVIGPIVQVVAAHQAVEALKLLVGDTAALDDRLRHFELWYNRDGAFQVAQRKRDDCPVCADRQYRHLHPSTPADSAVSLCGRNTVQVSTATDLDLDRLEHRLSPLGTLERNRFLLRLSVDDQHRLVIFPDGRVLVQGTDNPSTARSLVARYIGG